MPEFPLRPLLGNDDTLRKSRNKTLIYIMNIRRNIVFEVIQE